MNDLFTSARLLAELRKLGIGGAGTVRTTKTKREEIEEKTQSSQFSQSQFSQSQNHSQNHSQNSLLYNEVNRGLNPSISDIKIRHNTKIPWGTLYAELSHAESSVI